MRTLRQKSAKISGTFEASKTFNIYHGEDYTFRDRAMNRQLMSFSGQSAEIINEHYAVYGKKPHYPDQTRPFICILSDHYHIKGNRHLYTGKILKPVFTLSKEVQQHCITPCIMEAHYPCITRRLLFSYGNVRCGAISLSGSGIGSVFPMPCNYLKELRKIQPSRFCLKCCNNDACLMISRDNEGIMLLANSHPEMFLTGGKQQSKESQNYLVLSDPQPSGLDLNLLELQNIGRIYYHNFWIIMSRQRRAYGNDRKSY
jgi:hypothetical protein